MFFSKPFFNSGKENIKYLAPIPLYFKQFDDHEMHDRVFKLGYDSLNSYQRRMGQELPNQIDEDRISKYSPAYDRKDIWVEDDDRMPIGSRYFNPHNDFLDYDNEEVKLIKQRVFDGYKELIDNLNQPTTSKTAKVTESWLQFYEPTEGRGHNQHNHCNWKRTDEVNEFMFSGGYYLSDGDPILDHPYSGVFAFHLRDNQYMIRPKKGMLMIWPSDIVHSVKPFYGKTPRAVINFNIRSTEIKKNNLL